MRFSLLLASVLLSLMLFEPICAQDAAPSQATSRGFSMSQNFSYNGLTYTYRLSTPDLTDTPSWTPFEGEPPLSLGKALVISSVSFRRFVKDAEYWDVGGISLKQLDSEKWIYEISFSCNRRECLKGGVSSFPILIKMDGAIVEPEITSNPKQ